MSGFKLRSLSIRRSDYRFSFFLERGVRDWPLLPVVLHLRRITCEGHGLWGGSGNEWPSGVLAIEPVFSSPVLNDSILA